MKTSSEDKYQLKSPQAIVKAYTRHTAKCPHRRKKNFNQCSCAKHLSIRLRGQQPVRRTLNTPSWADAKKEADKVIESLDPKNQRLAELEREKTKRVFARVSLAESITRFLETKRQELAKDSRTPNQYKVATNMLTVWAKERSVTHLDEIKDTDLERWYWQTDVPTAWGRLKESTRSQRWTMLRSFFLFCKTRRLIDDNPIALIKKCKADKSVQGPYSVAQEEQLLQAALSLPIPYSIPRRDKAVYRQRLFAFILLLRYTGSDVCDAMEFRPERIRSQEIDGELAFSYSYFRRKTRNSKAHRIPCVMELPDWVAKTLLNVPLSSTDSAELPFRGQGQLRSDFWSAPIMRCLTQAGITHVSCGKGNDNVERFHTANVKQLRHTFAVRQLSLGYSWEEVAGMLGHTDTEMMRIHYAPFVDELYTATVARQARMRRAAEGSTRKALSANHGLTLVSPASRELAQLRFPESAS
ncbi:MAG TPA: hypothetical protein VGP83_17275 [Pyrinomonadaceae bacterium]|jgi:site-specific recombinase XerD|nr:hypothetical protein [Pyrinomonadaceae bacterium]